MAEAAHELLKLGTLEMERIRIFQTLDSKHEEME